jgi:CubicO group peptidase (beta-lactamase class C family)
VNPRGGLAIVLAAALCWFAPAQAAKQARASLDQASLLRGHTRGEVDLAAFAPPADALPPSRTFEGTLRISGKPRTRTILADEDFLTPAQIAAARTFPADFAYDFVQDGGTLLPVRRGYLVTSHPYWDVVLEPGRVWNEAGDNGYTRAALPFALIQKHMNCTHYGVLSFLFDDKGAVPHAALQISSETCHYLKFDLWGMFDATYTPHAVDAKAAVIAAYRHNRARRLPERPLARLAQDHPGIDPSTLAIGEANARTLYGLVVDGIHYVSPCPTRHGDYPYCDVLPLPSYSTAKSAEAALALMAMELAHPGTQGQTVAALAPVPGCATPAWHDVTLRHLLDMTSGHYDATGYMADEDAAKVQGFFHATTEQGKANFSCNAYPARSAPGATWAYHTSDTFLLGDTLARGLRRLPGGEHADIFRDVVDARIYRPLGLSATARTTRRTADPAAQPLFGYGLQFHRDDLARLALFIGRDGGRIDGKQQLDPHLLDLALQRIDGQRGAVVAAFPGFRYQLGFWARDVAPLLGCKAPTWVPFMSGFGGLSVVLYPDGVVYYNVADSGSARAFDWGPSAAVANRIASFCRQ